MQLLSSLRLVYYVDFRNVGQVGKQKDAVGVPAQSIPRKTVLNVPLNIETLKSKIQNKYLKNLRGLSSLCANLHPATSGDSCRDSSCSSCPAPCSPCPAPCSPCPSPCSPCPLPCSLYPPQCSFCPPSYQNPCFPQPCDPYRSPNPRFPCYPCRPPCCIPQPAPCVPNQCPPCYFPPPLCYPPPPCMYERKQICGTFPRPPGLCFPPPPPAPCAPPLPPIPSLPPVACPPCKPTKMCCSGNTRMICVPTKSNNNNMSVPYVCLNMPNNPDCCPRPEQPASYNNCNFYIKEVPSDMKDFLTDLSEDCNRYPKDPWGNPVNYPAGDATPFPIRRFSGEQSQSEGAYGHYDATSKKHKHDKMPRDEQKVHITSSVRTYDSNMPPSQNDNTLASSYSHDHDNHPKGKPKKLPQKGQNNPRIHHVQIEHNNLFEKNLQMNQNNHRVQDMEMDELHSSLEDSGSTYHTETNTKRTKDKGIQEEFVTTTTPVSVDTEGKLSSSWNDRGVRKNMLEANVAMVDNLSDFTKSRKMSKEKSSISCSPLKERRKKMIEWAANTTCTSTEPKEADDAQTVKNQTILEEMPTLTKTQLSKIQYEDSENKPYSSTQLDSSPPSNIYQDNNCINSSARVEEIEQERIYHSGLSTPVQRNPSPRCSLECKEDSALKLKDRFNCNQLENQAPPSSISLYSRNFEVKEHRIIKETGNYPQQNPSKVVSDNGSTHNEVQLSEEALFQRQIHINPDRVFEVHALELKEQKQNLSPSSSKGKALARSHSEKSTKATKAAPKPSDNASVRDSPKGGNKPPYLPDKPAFNPTEKNKADAGIQYDAPNMKSSECTEKGMRVHDGGYMGGKRLHPPGAAYCIPQDFKKSEECKRVVWRRKKHCCLQKKPDRAKTLCQHCHERYINYYGHFGLPSPQFFSDDERIRLGYPGARCRPEHLRCTPHTTATSNNPPKKKKPPKPKKPPKLKPVNEPVYPVPKVNQASGTTPPSRPKSPQAPSVVSSPQKIVKSPSPKTITSAEQVPDAISSSSSASPASLPATEVDQGFGGGSSDGETSGIDDTAPSELSLKPKETSPPEPEVELPEKTPVSSATTVNKPETEESVTENEPAKSTSSETTKSATPPSETTKSANPPSEPPRAGVHISMKFKLEPQEPRRARSLNDLDGGRTPSMSGTPGPGAVSTPNLSIDRRGIESGVGGGQPDSGGGKRTKGSSEDIVPYKDEFPNKTIPRALHFTQVQHGSPGLPLPTPSDYHGTIGPNTKTGKTKKIIIEKNPKTKTHHISIFKTTDEEEVLESTMAHCYPMPPLCPPSPPQDCLPYLPLCPPPECFPCPPPYQPPECFPCPPPYQPPECFPCPPPYQPPECFPCPPPECYSYGFPECYPCVSTPCSPTEYCPSELYPEFNVHQVQVDEIKLPTLSTAVINNTNNKTSNASKSVKLPYPIAKKKHNKISQKTETSGILLPTLSKVQTACNAPKKHVETTFKVSKPSFYIKRPNDMGFYLPSIFHDGESKEPAQPSDSIKVNVSSQSHTDLSLYADYQQSRPLILPNIEHPDLCFKNNLSASVESLSIASPPNKIRIHRDLESIFGMNSPVGSKSRIVVPPPPDEFCNSDHQSNKPKNSFLKYITRIPSPTVRLSDLISPVVFRAASSTLMLTERQNCSQCKIQSFSNFLSLAVTPILPKKSMSEVLIRNSYFTEFQKETPTSNRFVINNVEVGTSMTSVLDEKKPPRNFPDENSQEKSLELDRKKDRYIGKTEFGNQTLRRHKEFSNKDEEIQHDAGVQATTKKVKCRTKKNNFEKRECVPLRNCKSPRMITCEGQKPIFSIFPPTCPIRETFASILRKKNPARCRWHERNAEQFQDFCLPFKPYDPLKHIIKYVDRCSNHDPGEENASIPPKSVRENKRGVKRKLNI